MVEAVLFAGTTTWPDRCGECGQRDGERVLSQRKSGGHQTIRVVLCRVPGRPEERLCRRHLLDLIRPKGSGRRKRRERVRVEHPGQLELFK